MTHATQEDAVAAARAALQHLTDPEIPVVTLADLGILREVRAGDDGVTEVVITPTYSGCPAMGQIEDDVRAALHGAGVQARVITQLSPAWTTDWMSTEAREKLRAYGIAPPHGRATPATDKVVGFMRNTMRISVPCPRCRSTHTTETSPFGSTACKAMYRCLDCLEPFDHFKPY